jgi:hypothetical protein
MTSSSDFPTRYPVQTDQGEQDVFIAKLGASGSTLVYSTYLGGSDLDDPYGIAVDGYGCAYVTGWTLSTDFPLEDPFQSVWRVGEAFITKLGSFIVCGDADGSGATTMHDAVYLIAYILSGGTEPLPYISGDVDCSGAVDIDDVVCLVGYIFTGSPIPCDTDGDGAPDC